jgi:hypothetical protein
MKAKVINFVLFQIGWFACVLGGAHGFTVTASTIALFIIAYHIASTAQPADTFRLVAATSVIGAVFETLLVVTGLAAYQHGQWHDSIAPYWMVLMWPLFATTINSSLHWITTMKTPVISVIGAISAPLAYYAGNRLGAVEFQQPLLSLAVIGAGWAVLLPLVTHISCRIDEMSAATRHVHRGTTSHV